AIFAKRWLFFMKKYIPNPITALKLFAGWIGTVMVLNQEYMLAFYCVLASGIFDFFDGMSARALHVKSLIGKELDSLADVISFGFLPGAIIFTLLKDTSSSAYLPYLVFMITVFSALRSAKFNIDTRLSADCIGVNTPMNTFFVVALPFILEDYPVVKNTWLLLGIAILTGF